MNRSEEMFSRAKQIIPGGVNSPVRAFRSVGGTPIFIDRADGAKITDVDGNEYTDYVCSWGPMILGHNNSKILSAVIDYSQKGISFGAPTEIEVMLADKILEMCPNIDMVRMVNSGTEAVMSALRLARGYSGKSKVIKFEGCYHGHVDSMLVKAGSGAMTSGQPNSLGVSDCVAGNTLVAKYNNLDSVEVLLKNRDVACVIIEPVAANMGVVLPNSDFLQGLRVLCDTYDTLLIFDEVITGFRLCAGGAQQYYGVKADIVTYGKIIGGGMPVGAYGGKREIMECVAPCGGVYQAGTLSGNPLAMAAGLAQLNQLTPDMYEHINKMGERLANGLRKIIDLLKINACVTDAGSLVCLFFGIKKANSYFLVENAQTNVYRDYFNRMLKKGVYLAPSQFEAMFISYSHSAKIIDHTLEKAEYVLKQI